MTIRQLDLLSIAQVVELITIAAHSSSALHVSLPLLPSLCLSLFQCTEFQCQELQCKEAKVCGLGFSWVV